MKVGLRGRERARGIQQLAGRGTVEMERERKLAPPAQGGVVLLLVHGEDSVRAGE